jgi:hypothetical protein
VTGGERTTIYIIIAKAAPFKLEPPPPTIPMFPMFPGCIAIFMFIPLFMLPPFIIPLLFPLHATCSKYAEGGLALPLDWLLLRDLLARDFKYAWSLAFPGP